MAFSTIGRSSTWPALASTPTSRASSTSVRAAAAAAWPYVVIGVSEGVRYVAKDYRITLDGQSHRCQALLIAFANGQEYGMGMKIAPGAKLDDGLLEACVVEDRSVLARFRDARHLALGTVHRAPKMLVQGVRTAMIEGEGEIYVHLDGEPGVAHDRVSISIRPGALRVRV